MWGCLRSIMCSIVDDEHHVGQKDNIFYLLLEMQVVY